MCTLGPNEAMLKRELLPFEININNVLRIKAYTLNSDGEKKEIKNDPIKVITDSPI